MSSNFAAFFIRRLIAMIVVVFLITTIVFFLAHLSPYDPISLILGQKAGENPGAVIRLRHLFGLDQPLYMQYLNYMTGLLHGQLGYSEQAQNLGEPVWTVLSIGVPVSLKLSGWSLFFALLIGLPIGLISALRQNSPIDHAGQFVTMVGYAIPSFVIAPLAQLLFGVKLGWFPVSGWGDPGILGFKEMILPVAVFAIGLAGYFAKSFRSFMLEVLGQDYIRTARAKGLKERVVIYLHAIKNTLLPLASIVGPTAAYLVAGAFIIETIFSIPGIGYTTVTAVLDNNYPIIEATTLLLAVAVVVINFLTDIFYAMVDPRVRL
jgi:ABC-type dipeptide/oligopeptide/nickel transport system permease component